MACVWVVEESSAARYCFLDEVERPELREGLQKMHAPDRFTVVLQKTDGKAHAFSISKAAAAEHLEKSLAD